MIRAHVYTLQVNREDGKILGGHLRDEIFRLSDGTSRMLGRDDLTHCQRSCIPAEVLRAYLVQFGQADHLAYRHPDGPDLGRQKIEIWAKHLQGGARVTARAGMNWTLCSSRNVCRHHIYRYIDRHLEDSKRKRISVHMA